MSISSESLEFVEQKPAKLPAKLSFSQKCSFLSQYLKENRSFGDLNLGIQCSNPNTEGDEKSEMSEQRISASMNSLVSPNSGRIDLKPMNLFPEKSGLSLSNELSLAKMGDSSCESGKASQMTIFYGGKVFVFNDFSAEKAKELMVFAGTHDVVKPVEDIKPVISVIPLARKASLQRFLEKRKDRVIARAPYDTTSRSKSWLGLVSPSPQ